MMLFGKTMNIAGTQYIQTVGSKTQINKLSNSKSRVLLKKQDPDT